ncbi:porin [Marinimicrobium sp. ARAG 43.8]|uniref:porin n=1 Tax=Marinimicrobium sp. ARAG 43.8 TaxID=3418719 RepID=UPI003CE85558
MSIKKSFVGEAKRLPIKVAAIGVAVPLLSFLSTQAVFAENTIYGQAHVSLDFLDNGAEYSELNISSNASNIGFRGETQFEGITAYYQIEQQVDFNNSNGETFSTRDTFVGLRGQFGSVQIGRFDSPFKQARNPANLFGNQVGDIRNVTRVGDARVDERLPNTIAYQTPGYRGLVGAVSYSVSEQNVNPEGADADALSASVIYTDEAWDLALAYETHGEDTERGERDGLRLAGSYRINDAVRVVGFWQHLDHVNDTLDSEVIGAGFDWSLTTKTRLKAYYLVRDVDVVDANSELLAVGVEHRLHRNLRFYLNYASVANDDNAALTPWTQARTATAPGALGETTSGLSGGLRYYF